MFHHNSPVIVAKEVGKCFLPKNLPTVDNQIVEMVTINISGALRTKYIM